MNEYEAWFQDIAQEIVDEGVFSPDQIASLLRAFSVVVNKIQEMNHGKVE